MIDSLTVTPTSPRHLGKNNPITMEDTHLTTPANEPVHSVTFHLHFNGELEPSNVSIIFCWPCKSEQEILQYLGISIRARSQILERVRTLQDARREEIQLYHPYFSTAIALPLSINDIRFRAILTNRIETITLLDPIQLPKLIH